MNLFSNKIDQLIKAELGARPEQVRHFFERVRANYDESIQTATRFFLLMLAAWFLTYAIYKGWSEKIEILGFTLNRKMIVASPFLIGMLNYGLLTALAGAVVFWEALSRNVFHMLPTAWQLYLDDLLAPPTFSNIERMLEPESEEKLLSICSRTWFVLITLIMFAGSFAALAQTTYILFQSSPDAPSIGVMALSALSGALGTLAWLRGVVLFSSAIKATGGFELKHHRGEPRTLPPVECPKDSPQTSPNPSLQSPNPSSQRQPSGMLPGVTVALIRRPVRSIKLRRARGAIFVACEKR